MRREPGLMRREHPLENLLADTLEDRIVGDTAVQQDDSHQAGPATRARADGPRRFVVWPFEVAVPERLVHVGWEMHVEGSEVGGSVTGGQVTPVDDCRQLAAAAQDVFGMQVAVQPNPVFGRRSLASMIEQLAQSLKIEPFAGRGFRACESREASLKVLTSLEKRHPAVGVGRRLVVCRSMQLTQEPSPASHLVGCQRSIRCRGALEPGHDAPGPREALARASCEYRCRHRDLDPVGELRQKPLFMFDQGDGDRSTGYSHG